MATTIDLVGPLTAPVTVAGLALSSRLVMAPMTRFRSPGGVPTPEVAAYYARRAEHGIGLIVTEGTLVDHPSAGHETTVPRMTPGAAEAGWHRVTDAVHRAGGRIAAQLWHLGSERRPVDGRLAWTPSGIGTGTRAMSGSDFDTLLSAYGSAARVAARAGFDALEVHAAHGYLLDEFLWPQTNRRTDRWGGTPAQRAAFPAAVVRAVASAGLPVIVRFSQFKERDYTARIASDPAELAVLLDAFADAGAAMLHASQRRFWEPAFEGSPLNLAGWARRLTGLPTVTVGSVGLTRDILQSELMCRLIDGLIDGEYDLVALGRILLANPSWATLAAAGQLDKITDYVKAHEETYF
jgi:2,4-dienoyl-CoA reductase-like NADH-dependent reductase (Old Yellow Enzyme family)